MPALIDAEHLSKRFGKITALDDLDLTLPSGELARAGAAGVDPLNGWTPSLRAGLALMFLFTASAHWGKRRCDLLAMVPALFPHPSLIVTVTGILELLGAVGLMLPATARAGSVAGLAILRLVGTFSRR